MIQEYEMEVYRNSVARHLLPIIRDGVFHCANLESVQRILCDGFIVPNHGQFATTYPQALHSYGYSRGWISLFDFGSASEEECIRRDPRRVCDTAHRGMGGSETSVWASVGANET